MIDYRVSSYCHLGNCVAVGAAPGGGIAIADTKTDQAPLVFTGTEWAAFCEGVRRGEFDDLG
ncbi:MAG: DUF397 domain-containing protein [Pseudonocardia sp.]|nr:DUF397 domain-containing protein [Pseudonocardia sp.]